MGKFVNASVLALCLFLSAHIQAASSPYRAQPGYARTMELNGLTWHYLGATDDDAAFVAQGVRGYVDSFPVISVVYVGALNADGRPSWAGKRFVKLKVNCHSRTGAVIADAILDSTGNVVKDVDYPLSRRNHWTRLDDYFSAQSLLRYSKACLSTSPKNSLHNIR